MEVAKLWISIKQENKAPGNESKFTVEKIISIDLSLQNEDSAWRYKLAPNLFLILNNKQLQLTYVIGKKLVKKLPKENCLTVKINGEPIDPLDSVTTYPLTTAGFLEITIVNKHMTQKINVVVLSICP